MIFLANFFPMTFCFAAINYGLHTEDKELAQDSEECLPLETLKVHFRENASGLYYLTEVGRESSVSTH